MKNKLVIAALLAATSFGSGCIKKIKEKALDNGTITATVNGASFKATEVTAISIAGGFSMDGTTADGKQISISIPDASTTVTTYTIDSTYHQAWYYVNKSATGTDARSGTMTLNYKGTNGASGTFSFTCKDGTTVTNGSYDVHW